MNTADASPKTTVIKWQNPEAELDGLARYIQKLLRENSLDLWPSDVLVVVPNRRWALLARKALRHRKLEATLGGVKLGYPGDMNAPKYSPKRTHLLLTLLANAAAEKTAEVLESFNNIPGIDIPSFVEQKKSLRGFSLTKAVELNELKDYDEVIERMSGDETAPELLEMFEAAATHPTFKDDPHAIRIATFDFPISEDYKVVWILGAVDGFIPHYPAENSGLSEEQRAAQQQCFMSMLSRAQNELFVSYFSQIPLETANKLHISYARTRAGAGEKSALTKPSPFIQEAGDTLPGTIGGQAFLG